MKRVYELDGTAFSSLEELAAHFSKRVLVDYSWNGNLDAFNDILSGGFGTPEEGFVLRFVHTDAARAALGYPATRRWLEERAQKARASNRAELRARLEKARRGEGETLFDMIVAIIREHGPGGPRERDGVLLELL
jgi:RNAse (barnase) inhibitor barstar